MTKRIYILNGHPAEHSLSRTLAEHYAGAAQDANHEVRLAHLGDLDFDIDFGFGGYQQTKPLAPSLNQFLEDLEWADHIVIVTPMWWGGMPAKLKGLFDRTFLPGRTFDTREKTPLGFPSPLLSGRTARLIVTSDTPNWLMWLCYGNSLFRQVREQILGFVGIRPTRVTHFVGASHPGSDRVEHWLDTVKQIGTSAA